MTTRAEFLAAVRDRLREPIPENHLRPLTEAGLGEPIRYAVELSDPEARFLEAATGVGAEVVGRPEDDLRAILERVRDDVRPARAVVTDDPECKGVAPILASLGVEVLAAGGPSDVATADLGVTGALGGVALTGSLVMDSGRARTRLASLLPEVHLALLARDRIAATPGDFLRELSRWFPDGLPSNIVFITGPSRSADIELEITVGVHGPRKVLVALR
jgi:L-lactate utilization protein LutC